MTQGQKKSLPNHQKGFFTAKTLVYAVGVFAATASPSLVVSATTLS